MYLNAPLFLLDLGLFYSDNKISVISCYKNSKLYESSVKYWINQVTFKETMLWCRHTADIQFCCRLYCESINGFDAHENNWDWEGNLFHTHWDWSLDLVQRTLVSIDFLVRYERGVFLSLLLSTFRFECCGHIISLHCDFDFEHWRTRKIGTQTTIGDGESVVL